MKLDCPRIIWNDQLTLLLGYGMLMLLTISSLDSTSNVLDSGDFSICQSDTGWNKGRYCVKIFINDEQMLGELFARKLAALIGLSHVIFPEGILKKYQTTSLMKCNDKSLDRFNFANRSELWTMNSSVIRDIHNIYLPDFLIPDGYTLEFASNASSISNEVASWSELVIYDYLIGNIDRVLSHYINHQWNRNIFLHNVPNLAIFNRSHFIFFDNDGAFFQGYRIKDKYDDLHTKLLRQIRYCPGLLLDRLNQIQTFSSKRLQEILQSQKPLKILNDELFFKQSFPLNLVLVLQSRIKQVLRYCYTFNV